MTAFDDLSPVGRTSRIRRLALAVLQNFDWPVVSLRLLRAGFNHVFRVDRAAGKKYVLRVIHPEATSLEELYSELAWLEAIRREVDVVGSYSKGCLAG